MVSALVMPLSSSLTLTQFWYIAMPIYPIVVMLIKLSISLLLLRLMPLRWQKTIIYVVMAVTVLITPVQIGICLGICSHPSDWWNRDPERCDINSYKATVYIHSIISICTDVVLAVMPAIVLSRSQLPKKQKIATAGILAIGTWSEIRIHILCSISLTSSYSAGFVTVIKVVFAHQVDLNDYLCESLTVVYVVIASTLILADTSTWLGFSSAFETCLGITAGCLATFRPFFTKVKGRNMRRADSVGADGRLSFSKEMGAETIRGDWDPGLTITFDPELDEEVERAPSISPSRRSSDISLPIQAHKDFEHVPDNNGWTFRKLII